MILLPAGLAPVSGTRPPVCRRWQCSIKMARTGLKSMSNPMAHRGWRWPTKPARASPGCRKKMRARSSGGSNMKSIAIRAAAIVLAAAGCAGEPLTTREKGTLLGGGLGAATGSIIGAAVGSPGAGAAIGGAIGGVGGFAVGNSMQNNENAQAQTQGQIQQQQQQLEQQRQQIQQLKQQQET